MLSKGGNKHMRTLNNTEWGGGGAGDPLPASRAYVGGGGGGRHETNLDGLSEDEAGEERDEERGQELPRLLVAELDAVEDGERGRHGRGQDHRHPRHDDEPPREGELLSALGLVGLDQDLVRGMRPGYHL